MATVLFTYEFGAGFGHLNRLIAVAKQLRTGNRLVFAIPEVKLGEPVIRRALGSEPEIRQGVFWAGPKSPDAQRVPTHTFADVIRLFGFHRGEALLDAVHRWLDLLTILSPHLIVSDFAPTLRLASSGKVPAVVLGSGYTIPPTGQLLPLMRPWADRVPPQSRVHEGLLLAAANQVRARLGGPAVDFFADLFQGERTFVCTLAEFDPYRSARKQAPLWPFNVPKMPPARDFSRRQGAPVFCYFQEGHPALKSILSALSKLHCRSEIYVRGIDPRQIAANCTPRVSVHTSPADFGSVLPGASLLLHHAGIATSYAGLAAGVPQVVLPRNLEQLITARALDEFKVAVPFSPERPPEPAKLTEVLEGVLTDTARQTAALQTARDIDRRRTDNPLEPVTAACRAYL